MRQVECRESRFWLAAKILYIVLATCSFFLLTRAVRAGKTDKIDHQVTRAIQRIDGQPFANLMNLVSWPGFPPQSRILPLLYPLMLRLAGYNRAAKFQLAAWGTSILSGITKLVMRRPRPEHPEIEVGRGNISGSSFPSGHVLNYVGVYGFLGYLAHLHIASKWLRRGVVGICTGLVALVGPSRIYLGHHWISDVTASYLLGSSYLLALTSIYKHGLCKILGRDSQ